MSNYAKEYRIYKPNRTGNGSAAAFQLSYKSENKFDPWIPFLVVCPQTGMDDKGNASFDWKGKAINVKLGEADIGEIMAVLERRKPSVGTKGSLFHQSEKGSKVIGFEHNKECQNYNLSVSSKGADKDSEALRYRVSISEGEGSVLLTLLKQAILKMYNW